MRQKQTILFFAPLYVVSVAGFFFKMTGEAVSGQQLTAMCIESSLPCMELIADNDTEPGDENITAAVQTETEKSKEDEKIKPKKVKKNNGAPKVLIYHTHATESYLPASSGNYHTTKEENTVRDAGDVLTDVLEERGIGVVHDKTLHDNPSYNESYSRSFETVKALLKKYPSIECIIDLHRDATAAEVAGPVQTVGGKTCAVYSYVLSNTTETYEENSAFLGKLNTIADSKYGGYTGEILERPYWYNQELSGKSILIEMGNNRNNIEDVRRCAEVFGEILADALEE